MGTGCYLYGSLPWFKYTAKAVATTATISMMTVGFIVFSLYGMGLSCLAERRKQHVCKGMGEFVDLLDHNGTISAEQVDDCV